MKLRARPYDMRVRLWILGGVMIACCAALLARAAWMQLINPEFYVQQGDMRFVRELPIATSRGMIVDRNGEPLAVSTPVESLWVNPKEIKNHPKEITKLAKAIGINRDELNRKIARKADKEFMYVRRHINPDVAQAVLALEIPGLYSQREFRRFYPQGEATAHVLGFTNVDDVGQEGLELAFNEWLTGTAGKKKVIRDRKGRIVENVELINSPQPGKELMLSIDRRIQYLAYRELKSALQINGAASGSVVVLDVKSGEVLAMVNQPSYNPNTRNISKISSHRNRAVTDVIEPGSVIKAVTVAAALDNGVNPNIVIQTSPGTMQVADHVVRDVRNYGPVTMTSLLTKSSNIGATKLAMAMPNQKLYDALHNCGFGQNTGSGFPGEATGVLPAPRSWGPVEKATISYGYGLSATPLQIAQCYAAFANKGVRLPPTFIKNGNQERSDQFVRAMDEQTSHDVIRMMETVIGPEGTAQKAAITGYRVAGKTGTSRIASAGGYQKRYISAFAGMVPVEDPKFAVVVVINDPSGHDYYGGLVSAPVFHNVMDGALRLMDVPPDNMQAWYEQQANTPMAGAMQ
jgi:cell division protein FtsI (penicillin-binding protein 3)